MHTPLTCVNNLCYYRNMHKIRQHKIRQFLTEKNMTQAELADLLGYSESLMSLVINGKRPVSYALRYKWLEQFGIAALTYLDEQG